MGLSLISGKQLLAKIGGELLDKFTARDPAQGGVLAMITGEQGAGKTSLMFRIAEKFVGKEYIIWRGRFLAQWHKLPNWREKVIVFVHEDDDVEFLKLPYGEGEAERIDVPLVRYKDVEDVLKKLRRDKINIIYEPPAYRISEELAGDVKERTGYTILPEKFEVEKPAYFWFEFLYRLLTREDRDWYSVFIDEVDDVFPETPSGPQFALQAWVKDILKDLRKALVSLIVSTHTIRNVDWRIRTKIPVYIYLKGAEPKPGSKIKPVFLALMDSGYAYIEWGRFGAFTFKYLPQPNYDILVRRCKEG